MTRQEFMLAVLAAGNGEPHGPVQVQKLFFLLDRNVAARVGGPWFDFQPDSYGPFDKAVFEELRALAARALVVIVSPANGPRVYRLTPQGFLAGQRLRGELPAAIADYFRKLSAWVLQLSLESLVSAIYHEFPEMKVRAVFAEGP